VDENGVTRNFMVVKFFLPGSGDECVPDLCGAFAVDISETQAAQQKYKDLSEWYEMATDAGNIGVWHIDLETRRIAWSQRQRLLYECDPNEDFKIEQFMEMLHPDDKEGIADVITKASSGLILRSRAEFRIITPKGNLKHLEGLFRVGLDAQGKPVYMRGVDIEVTAIKAAEEKLIKAKETAEAADNAKSSFLAVMSHEIRTPLNGILGYAQLLCQTPLNHEQKNFISVIESSGQALLVILNDILDLSRIEAGKVPLEIVECDLGQLMGEIVAMFNVSARTKGLSLHLTISDNVPKHLKLDPGRVRQICTNLIGNAVKFTETGFVRVTISCPSSRSSDDVRLQIRIEDSGIGISKEAISFLFKPFSQADSSISRKFGRTGLGLVISYKLCELMNGSLSVDSRIGAGSTFTATISCEEANLQESKPSEISAIKSSNPSSHLRILVGEDNLVNQKFLGHVLKSMNHDFIIGSNGREVVDHFKFGPYDLILMDLQMPEMSGIEATQEIRCLEKASGLHRTPIIAVTADAMINTKTRCLACGIDDYISKPIHIGTLKEMISRWSK